MDITAGAILDRVQKLRSEQPDLLLDPDVPNFTGHVSAKYLIVGNRTGALSSSSQPKHWPFFHNSGAAKFLYQAFHLSRLDEAEFAWTNATGYDSDRILPMIKKYGWRVICLGERASQTVSRYTDDWTFVMHPNSAIFHNLSSAVYANKLVSAVRNHNE